MYSLIIQITKGPSMIQKQFKRIYVEITNVCNLSCSFCPPLKRSKSFMSVEEFNHIAKTISPFTDYIYLHVKGEPLLHDQLKEILSICDANNLHANITTNGTRLGEAREILYSSPSLRQINISLHSFENVNDSSLEEFDMFLNTIFTVSKHLASHTPTLISLRLWNLDKDNLSESSKVRNHYVLKRIKDEFILDYNISEALEKNKGIKLSDKIYLNQDYEFTWPSLGSNFISDKGYCYGLKTQLAILVDGTIIPCCLDGDGVINLGNIFIDDLATILQSERVTSIQKGFLTRTATEELCKRCEYKERF